ncbi:unnamed protein product [Protopolystoma xenopodis]|uniref:Uncharacterized protein n=1 Tax=Protopolystoma xenopodis TaxID=117903 RepID=A0A3S5B8G8_9PLAT|nr:unnamed protein product [Protopolystoma xenopodis]
MSGAVFSCGDSTFGRLGLALPPPKKGASLITTTTDEQLEAKTKDPFIGLSSSDPASSLRHSPIGLDSTTLEDSYKSAAESIPQSLLPSKVSHPCRIIGLAGVRVVKVAAHPGSKHALALTDEG